MTNRPPIRILSDMQECFAAGKLSPLFSISVRTLHYYDSIGVLIPSIIRDARTGTRLCQLD